MIHCPDPTESQEGEESEGNPMAAVRISSMAPVALGETMRSLGTQLKHPAWCCGSLAEDMSFAACIARMACMGSLVEQSLCR